MSQVYRIIREILPISLGIIDDEYSSSKAKNAKHMARDQQGSRLLQRWISLGNQKIVDEIFANVLSINPLLFLVFISE